MQANTKNDFEPYFQGVSQTIAIIFSIIFRVLAKNWKISSSLSKYLSICLILCQNKQIKAQHYPQGSHKSK